MTPRANTRDYGQNTDGNCLTTTNITQQCWRSTSGMEPCPTWQCAFGQTRTQRQRNSNKPICPTRRRSPACHGWHLASSQAAVKANCSSLPTGSGSSTDAAASSHLAKSRPISVHGINPLLILNSQSSAFLSKMSLALGHWRRSWPLIYGTCMIWLLSVPALAKAMTVHSQP